MGLAAVFATYAYAKTGDVFFLTLVRKTIKLKLNLIFLHLQIITLCIKKIVALKEINILKRIIAVIRSDKVSTDNVILT